MECLGQIYNHQSDTCKTCKELSRCYMLQRAAVEAAQYKEHEAERREERHLQLLRKKGYAIS